MKTAAVKRYFLALLLVLSSAAMAFGISSDVSQESMASFFTDPSTGNHVDSQGNVWYVPGFDYEGKNGGRAKVMYHAPLNRTMVLTKVMSSDAIYPPTCNQSCSKLTGSNNQPMKCVDNVSSFPYLGTAGGKLFYPHANTFISRFPGHGAHGGNYDIVCLAGSSQGSTGACSGTWGDTISTCPQCAKNLDPHETLARPSTFSDGAIVACAESPTPLVANDQGSGSGNIIDNLELALTFDRFDSRDSSGKARHAVGSDKVSYTTQGCRKGACADFDGVEAYLSASNIYDISGDITVALWMRAGNQVGGSLGSARIFDAQRAGDTGMNVYLDAGRVVLDNAGGPSQVLPTSLGANYEDNGLHHVAAVRSGSSYTLYVDGNIVGTRSGSATSYNGLTLGKWSIGTDHLDGLIDEVYVLSKALNQSEIQTVMNNGIDISINTAAVVALPPAVTNAEVNGAYIVEVGPGQTGTSQCALQNKICLGGALTNRVACQEFYPHALTNNENAGYASSFKCTGGSSQNVEPCVDTNEDTCSVAISTGDVFGCDELVKDGVDSAFIECADPFSPTVLNEVGGFLPAISTPAVDTTTGLVPYTVTISHPLDQSTSVTVAYQLVGSTETFPASLHPGTGSADVSQGTADQDSSLPIQIGSQDAIDTDTFDEVSVNFSWDPRSDLTDTSGTYVLVITVTDEDGNTTTDFSPEFTLDFSGVPDDSELPQGSFDDIDGDGVLNADDPDMDGDGISNIWDEDVDGDGLSNSEDTDDDADGTNDVDDDSPTGLGSLTDIDGDGIPNGSDPDIDGDGLLNGVDPDVDGDGIPNGQDSDIDGDGIPNDQDPDMDGDGILNEDDPDMDGDGLLNGDDPDVDGDGIANGLDPDVDGDGILNGDDPDVDGDGILNGDDPDVDGDGILNGEDPDVDGDGIANINDPDVDGDGILNGDDPDVDGDGILNGEDPDVDGDGIPNDQDGDIDGDGTPNDQDPDTDGDGTENALDPDADGDGVTNEDDQSPNGRNTNVGVPEDPAESALKGAGENCFEAECTQDQKKEFFEDLIEKRQSGLLGDAFQGVEQNIVEFIVRLYEQGYSLEELTANVISRQLAIDIAVQVLMLRGNVTQEILDLVSTEHFPDVSNDTASGRNINILTDLGVVSGFPDGLFHAQNTTTIVQAAKIIVNTAAIVSTTEIGSVLKNVLMNDGTLDWYFPFLKTLDQLNIDLISQQISSYTDYASLGMEIDLIQYLRLFDRLSDVIGIEDILSTLDTILAG